MNASVEDWGLSPDGAARVRELLHEGEKAVLVVKPRTKLNVTAAVQNLLTGVLLLCVIGGVMWVLRDIWWYVVLTSAVFLVPGAIVLSLPWRQRRRTERTLYLLTDSRVVLVEPGMLCRESVQEFPLTHDLVQFVRSGDDGYGDIVFVRESRSMMGLPFVSREHIAGFLNIPHAERVAELIEKQVVARVGESPEPESSRSFSPELLPESRAVQLMMGGLFLLLSLMFAGVGIYLWIVVLSREDWIGSIFTTFFILSALVGLKISGGMIVEGIMMRRK